MKETHESKRVRVYSRRELAQDLGMNPSPTDEITVTSTTENVTIVVRSQKAVGPLG